MFFKRKSIFTLLFFILVFLLVSEPAFTQQTLTEEAKKLKEFKVSYPNTSLYYRGVVAMDADGDGASRDEFYCDFGSVGLWVHHYGTWTKINSSNPEWIFSFRHGGTDYLLADFGAVGLWYWYYSGSWTGTWVKISNADATYAFATDDEGDGSQEIHVNFSGLGLWRYDMAATTKWTKINSLNSAYSSLRMNSLSIGWEEGAHDFGATGLWRFYPNFWTKLSSSNPDDDNVSANVDTVGTAEELIVDFAGLGLWVLDGATHAWNKINSLNTLDAVAVRFEGAPDYELLCSFTGAAGLWYWNYTGYPGTWTKINATTPHTDGGFCEPFDPNGKTEVNGDQEVAVDFGSVGLWLYDFTGSAWTKLNASDPQFMIACDYFGDGRDVTLVVDFGAGVGLWVYDGFSVNWFKINDLSPDGVN